MKKRFLLFSILLSVLILNAQDLHKKAEEIAHSVIIVDSHIDLPVRLYYHPEDISKETKDGNFDYVRAVAGGLDAPFMAIYVPANLQGTPKAAQFADSSITLVNDLINDNPDKFAHAYSVNDIKENFKRHLISLPMGMENGAAITDLKKLKEYYDKGIRYVTLTHSKDNNIGDSSYDTTRTWHGLSNFGKKLVVEMNKIGMMIDVSHITDDTFFDVMKITKAPVIASHSSCRYFTPGVERNMSDEMIKMLADNGGVIQINFGSYFLDSTYEAESKEFNEHVHDFMEKNGLKRDDPKVKKYREKYLHDHPIHFADVSTVADHIDHVVNLVGIDHVGIGSDYDGVGDSLPTGLKDVSQYPNLIAELLKRGYTKKEIEKVLSGNFFRVWNDVAKYAKKLN